MHLHITANQRAGGAVIYGEPFDPYGISEALGHDADVHGADGSADVTGNLLRTGLPFGTHDTHGWPTFSGWPVNDTVTHQQTYYVWLQRAWMAGERLVVAQTVEDQPICEIEPVKVHSCDETEAVRQQIQTLRGLQGYVDAQAGGKGKGWFRLVYNPRQARAAIEKGRLAVLIGIESSNLFGCSEQAGQPECSRRDVDRGIRRARALGVRSVFPMHWTDNAFGGSALEGGAKGLFINVLEAFQTGHYFRTGPCPEPGQGEETGHSQPVRAGCARELLPGGGAAGAGGDADLSARAPVQRKRPDAAREVPDQAADGEPHADRDGSHGRVGPRGRAPDGDAAAVIRSSRAIRARAVRGLPDSSGSCTGWAAWPPPPRIKRRSSRQRSSP